MTDWCGLATAILGGFALLVVASLAIAAIWIVGGNVLDWARRKRDGR